MQKQNDHLMCFVIQGKSSNLCARSWNSKILLTLVTKRLPVCKFLQKNLFWAVWKMFRKVCMDYEVDFEAWNKTIFKGMKNNIFLTCFSCSTIFLSIDDIYESLVGANFRYLR